MAENKNWVLILNPIAGNGFVKKYEDTIKEKLNEFGVNADLVYTQKKGHASQIAEEYAKKGYKNIINPYSSNTVIHCVITMSSMSALSVDDLFAIFKAEQ